MNVSSRTLNQRFRAAPTRRTLRALSRHLNSTYWEPLSRSEWVSLALRLKHLPFKRERIAFWRMRQDLTRVMLKVADGRGTARDLRRLSDLWALVHALLTRDAS